MEIDWQWLITQAEKFFDDPEKKKVSYEDDQHSVTMYRVTGNVIRTDIKIKEA